MSRWGRNDGGQLGDVRCWGDNAGYQIGDGTRIDRRSPTPVDW